jgi:hypothetical protein
MDGLMRVAPGTVLPQRPAAIRLGRMAALQNGWRGAETPPYRTANGGMLRCDQHDSNGWRGAETPPYPPEADLRQNGDGGGCGFGPEGPEHRNDAASAVELPKHRAGLPGWGRRGWEGWRMCGGW